MNEYFIKSDDDIQDLRDELAAKRAMADDEWHGGPLPTEAELDAREAEYAEDVYIPDTEEEMRPRFDEDRPGARPVWDNPEALPARKPADHIKPKKPEAA